MGERQRDQLVSLLPSAIAQAALIRGDNGCVEPRSQSTPTERQRDHVCNRQPRPVCRRARVFVLSGGDDGSASVSINLP